jgi:thymidylate synthase ThyX
MSTIILHSCVNAEDNAMLQALYSRSADSVIKHLEKLEAVGSSNFMSNYYLGYGHASIGDCGNETMYIEGISMLAAKAIEDNPLFVGQECSSRYIDFSNQPFYDPTAKNSELSGKIANLYTKYRQFYVHSLDPLKVALRSRFPKAPETLTGTYEKAIAARAFDILRGFLPAGATTNVAWTGRLSNAAEHCVWMMHHPLTEVQQLGQKIYAQLWNKYPNSFHAHFANIYGNVESPELLLRAIEGDDLYEFSSDFQNFYGLYHEITNYSRKACWSDVTTNVDIDSPMQLNWFKFGNRPRKAKLWKHGLATYITANISATMDFGSFRDIQRHRNGYCSMPLLEGTYGIHPWYYDNLTPDLQKNADELLAEVERVYELLAGSMNDERDFNSLATAQYALPMGNIVEVSMKYSMQQAIYVAELRSGKTVHPTCRTVAQEIGEALFEHGIPVKYDTDPSDWTVKRGEQDIIAKT